MIRRPPRSTLRPKPTIFCKSSAPGLRPRSLAPETCGEHPRFANLSEDQVRQAKAERTLVLRARVRAWLRYRRSLAWWQGPSLGWRFDPVGEISKPIVTGPNWIPFP